MPDRPTDIMIFGAGFGTRMRPLTDTLPKPLVPVAGIPLIDRAIALADDAGLNIHVNAHYRADQLVAALPAHVTPHIESPDILDTGGGLKSALPKMQGAAVATLNPDAVWQGPNPLHLLLDHWTADLDALLMMVPLDRAVGRTGAGDFLFHDDGSLTRDPAGALYTGAQIITRKAVEAVPGTAFSLNAAWDRLERNSRMRAIVYPGRWADVGTPEGVGLAEGLLHV